MKVLKKPDTESWKKEKHCHKCTAELEIIATDIHAELSGGTYSYHVICPECQERLTVAKSDLTQAVQAFCDKSAKTMPSINSYYDR